MKNPPKTFVGLMHGVRWKMILRLFRRNECTLILSTSEESMGKYYQVTLDGGGFKVVSAKAALQAAFTGNTGSSSRVLTSPEEVLELILDSDNSLSEAGVVDTIVQKVDELLLLQKE